MLNLKTMSSYIMHILWKIWKLCFFLDLKIVEFPIWVRVVKYVTKPSLVSNPSWVVFLWNITLVRLQLLLISILKLPHRELYIQCTVNVISEINIISSPNGSSSFSNHRKLKGVWIYGIVQPFQLSFFKNAQTFWFFDMEVGMCASLRCQTPC